ncbi:MAG: hypothetical protein HY584_04130, partial [Candidatus Omnitrophica bacterium]|nr:hypothetical protein [Candidatus Omnitrophota bacterium]
MRRRNELTRKHLKQIFTRIVAVFIILSFASLQILPPGWPLSASLAYGGADVATLEKDVQKLPEQEVSIPPPSITDQPVPVDPSTRFLLDSPLSPPDASLRASPSTGDLDSRFRGNDSLAKHQDDISYDYERYEFEDAMDLLRPEYASAVIVKSLTKENLDSLLDLDFEVALIVLSGELVLFTTGNEEEIGVTHAAQSLLKQASFISHTHVTGPSQSGPSSFDLNHAVESPLEEYVLTQNGAYAYN